MTSNRDFLRRFISDDKKDEYDKIDQSDSVKTVNEYTRCILCNSNIMFQAKKCNHCGGPIGNITAQKLKKLWGLEANHILYFKHSTWYQLLNKFPAILCSPNGYIKFENEAELNTCSYLRITKKINVPIGIENIPGFVHMKFVESNWEANR